MKRIKRIIAIYLAAVMLLLSGCDEKQNDASLKSSVSFFAMDTYITVTAYGENAEQAANASTQTAPDKQNCHQKRQSLCAMPLKSAEKRKVRWI